MRKDEELQIENEWNEFRNSVYETKSKSQDDFEKYINVLASGGLAISIAFFDKIVDFTNAKYIFLIVFGWLLLTLTLLINLISHYKSINYSQCTIDEINVKDYDSVIKNVSIRNKKINRYNYLSIISLIVGIALIITFVTLNVFDMNNDKPKPQQPKPATEEKGRTIVNPPQSKPTTNPKK